MYMTIPTKENFEVIMREVNNVPIEDLAFAKWQTCVNEKAYADGLITKAMYEFAREELRKKIDRLSNLCYSTNESR